MAQAGAALVQTFAASRVLLAEWQQWGLPQAVVPRMAGVEEAMTRATRLAHDTGIAIGSGSDLLGAEQNRHGLELVLKARILGPMAAIVSATATNARIMRVDDRLGTVTPGKLPDPESDCGHPGPFRPARTLATLPARRKLVGDRIQFRRPRVQIRL